VDDEVLLNRRQLVVDPFDDAEMQANYSSPRGKSASRQCKQARRSAHGPGFLWARVVSLFHPCTS